MRFGARADSHIAKHKQIHRLRHVISELAAQVPEARRGSAKVRELASWGCKTILHVVRLLAPRLPAEDHAKDIDFTPAGIKARCEAGYLDTQKVLAERPWEVPIDPLEGVAVHDHASAHGM